MTECCLFVCCRPPTYVRLVNDIYPKNSPVSGPAKPRKLKELANYSASYPRKFPYIVSELERRIRSDIKSNSIDYVHIGILALRQLITHSLADDMIGIASSHVTRLLAHLMTTSEVSYWEDALGLFIDYSTLQENIDFMETFIPLLLRCFTDTTELPLQLVCLRFIHRVLEIITVNPIAPYELPISTLMPILYTAAIAAPNDPSLQSIRDEAIECFCTLCSASIVGNKVMFAMSSLFVQCDEHMWEGSEGMLTLLKAADTALRSNPLHYYENILLDAMYTHARNIALSSNSNYLTTGTPTARGVAGSVLTPIGPRIPTPSSLLRCGSEAAIRSFPVKLSLLHRILSVAKSLAQYKLSPAGAPNTPHTTTVLRLLQPVDKPLDDLCSIVRYVASLASSNGLPIIAAPYCSCAPHVEHTRLEDLSANDRFGVDVVQLVIECIVHHCVKCNRVRMASDVVQCIISYLIRTEPRHANASTIIYNLRGYFMSAATAVCKWLAGSHSVKKSEASVHDVHVSNAPPLSSADICYVSYCLQEDNGVLFSLSADLIRHCAMWCETKAEFTYSNHRDAKYCRAIIIDTVFNVLCSSHGKSHAYNVSVMWSILEVMLQGCGSLAEAVTISLPMILALEDFWVSYPIDGIVTEAPQSVLQASLEMLDSQMIFVATYFTYIAKYYDCPVALKSAETIEKDRQRLKFDQISRLAVIDGLLTVQQPKQEYVAMETIRFTGINRKRLVSAIQQAGASIEVKLVDDSYTPFENPYDRLNSLISENTTVNNNIKQQMQALESKIEIKEEKAEKSKSGSRRQLKSDGGRSIKSSQTRATSESVRGAAITVDMRHVGPHAISSLNPSRQWVRKCAAMRRGDMRKPAHTTFGGGWSAEMIPLPYEEEDDCYEEEEEAPRRSNMGSSVYAMLKSIDKLPLPELSMEKAGIGSELGLVQ